MLRHGCTTLAVLALAVAGCGSGDSETASTTTDTAVRTTVTADPAGEIREAVVDFYGALSDGDADAACEVLSDDGQAEVIAFAGVGDRADADDCVSAVEGSYLAENDPAEYEEVGERVAGGDVDVDGDRAEITSEHGLPVRLVNESDRWLIDSLGLEASTAETAASDTNVDVAAAKVAISKFCADAIGYLVGARSKLPSPKRFREKDEAIDTLIRMYHEDPNATLPDGSSIEDEIIDAISSLENGDCDTDAAARLDRTIR